MPRGGRTVERSKGGLRRVEQLSVDTLERVPWSLLSQTPQTPTEPTEQECPDKPAELTEAVRLLIRETANSLKAAQRRRFLAQTVTRLQLGQRQAQKLFGWGRDT